MTYLDDMEREQWLKEERLAWLDWSDAIDAAREAMRFGQDIEVCGYITAGRVVLCENQSAEHGRFALSDDDCMLVYDALENGVLDGVWHSHPHGETEPSSHDWEGHPQGVPMYILCMSDIWDPEVRRFGPEARP